MRSGASPRGQPLEDLDARGLDVGKLIGLRRTAKADGRTPPEVGETVELSADPENLHVFDAQNGEALT